MMTEQEKALRLKLYAMIILAILAGALVVLGAIDGNQWLQAIKATMAIMSP